MRTTFIDTLCQVAVDDPRVWLLTADLGYSVLERFAQRFPDRYVNVGVAEQNLTGVAAGLAASGKVVFTYSIANFPTLRCLEQTRNDVCYHNLNVKVVAVGGGYSYGTAGYTHHAVEDLAVMRILPNMTVVAPGDPVEVGLAVAELARHSGPAYLRLGKGREPLVYSDTPSFQLGKAIEVRAGHDVTLISTGGMLSVAVEAAEILARQNVQTRILSMHTLQPLDAEAVLCAARETRHLITIEEHRMGGLFSAVAEVLVPYEGHAPVRGINLAGCLPSLAGSQKDLRKQFGLDSRSLVKTVLSLCGPC